MKLIPRYGGRLAFVPESPSVLIDVVAEIFAYPTAVVAVLKLFQHSVELPDCGN